MAAGYQNKAVLNNGTTWGTLPALNFATLGVSLASMPAASMSRADTDPSGVGMEFPGTTNRGGIVASDMTFDFLLSYEHIWRAMSLFTSDTVTAGEGGPPAQHFHAMTPPASPQRTFIGAYINVPNPGNTGDTTRGLQVKSFAGTGFELSGTLGEVAQLSISGIPYSVEPVAAATITAATFPAGNSLITVGAGDTDLFAIATAGDPVSNLGISSFTFRWNTPREAGAHTTAEEYVALPDRSGTGTGELVIRVPGFVPTASLAEFTTPTEKNALITLPSATVGAAAMSCKIKFPRLVLKAFDPAGSGTGATAHEFTYRIYADPEGTAEANCDTAGGAPWEITVANSESADYDTAVSS